MQPSAIANSNPCLSSSSTENYFAWGGSITLAVGICGVLLLARRFGRVPEKRWQHLGSTIKYAGLLTLTVSYTWALILGRKGPCGGEYNSLLTNISLAGLVILLLGLLITMSAEWGAIACVVCLDFGLAISLIGGMLAGRQAVGAAVVILLVHGVCTTAAAWWSWQLRESDDPVARARASEAGRILAAAWVVLAVLGSSAAAFGRDNPSLTVQDSTAISVFVVAAIGLIMGTGYTKYAEAIDSHRKQSRLEEAKSAALVGTAHCQHRTAVSALTVLVVTAGVLRRTRGSSS